jgi:hypothetical protein
MNDEVVSVLCKERPRCTLARHRPVRPSKGGLEIVDIRIAHSPAATTDEDRCDRREYWLVGPTKRSLLATDCESQWGADNGGPATTSLDGTRFRLEYVEFQSGDSCEVMKATIGLAPLHVEQETRKQGTVRRDQCVAQKPLAVSSPSGDGSLGRPVVLLHR